MTAVPLARTWGTMRIVALPLTRTPHPNARKLLNFYSYRIIASPKPTESSAPPRSFFTRWMPNEGLARWASHKASRTWAEFGMAEKGTMKLRAFQLGERLMDRLDFEESNLKTIDLSIAPPSKKSQVSGSNAEEEWANTQVPLLYPPTVLSGPQSLENLKTLVEQRIPLHQKGLATWIFFAILSAPLKLIPIIPNFPFYFCAWRSWSHLKALRTARYLEGLLGSNKIVPQPLKELNAVYSNPPPRAKLAGVGEDPTIVTRKALERAMRVLTMEPEEAKELLRAHDQVVVRLKSASSAT
ncbi:mitochondrial K+-H+ exchange-related-domain-containing protein [Mycena sp. CBHHK59/15]|nr:mitochondrial K+-H+ exchange-related-domain-containing protein [Mycena sp. CBHHK59/15]